jgi:capsule polysaccharide export protein KpsE/RkpR
MDYWNDSVQRTGTGRPVDALIMPVAPFPAARPGRYLYYGYTVIVNVLDYTSVVVPVMVADKELDKKDEPPENADGVGATMAKIREATANDCMFILPSYIRSLNLLPFLQHLLVVLLSFGSQLISRYFDLSQNTCSCCPYLILKLD